MNRSLRRFVASLQTADPRVTINALPDGFLLKERFTEAEWENMFPHSPTQEAFDSFRKTAHGLAHFLGVWSNHTREIIGFVLVFIDDERRNGTVSLHGGGWLRTLGASRLYIHAYRLVAEMLVAGKVTVHTSTLNRLTNVIAFNRAAGFVRYRVGSERTYMRYRPAAAKQA